MGIRNAKRNAIQNDRDRTAKTNKHGKTGTVSDVDRRKEEDAGESQQDKGTLPAKTRRGLWVTTTAKYLIPATVFVAAAWRMHNAGYAVGGILELALTVLCCTLLARFNRVLAWAVSVVLLALLGLQAAVLLFGNSFLSAIMVTSLDSIEDISGNTSLYVGVGALLAIAAFLPLRRTGSALNIKKGFMLVGISLLALASFSQATEASYSPLGAYAGLVRDLSAIDQRQRDVAAAAADTGPKGLAEHFYRAEVTDGRQKPGDLGESPNLVVIFTEGLSQRIIDDERGVMPNVSSWQKRSLSFKGYINHTFATYRGIIGQLFSGYQLNDYDANMLVSLQGILKDAGYRTAFINPEGYNPEFCTYLDSLGFDEVIDESPAGYHGPIGDNASMSDHDIYDTLFYEMEARSNEESPFMISLYTFGTHVSFDSMGNRFADGSNSMLNKFFDLDTCFGEFMKKFESSDMADNTIIVFTTDHATYHDSDYMDTFEESSVFSELSVDEIPLIIYHKGVKPEVVDADGRNSLDLAPTVLDYLDISAPNYFLGQSLFLDKSESQVAETTFCSQEIVLSTNGTRLQRLNDAEYQEFEKELNLYYAAKLKDPEV